MIKIPYLSIEVISTSVVLCLWMAAFSTTLSLGACKDKQDMTEEVVPEKTNDKIVSTKTDSSEAFRTILFFGNSLTAGYGLDEEFSFPSLIQDRIDSLGLPYQVVNAGLSGETSAGGKGRIDWVLREPVDVFVLELGANDVLRGLELDATEQNLRDILDTVRKKSPKAAIIIAGMEAPPNMGTGYTNQFRQIFSSLAKDYNAGLIPFLLDGVAGIPSLNLPDAKHPNKEGQKVVRDNVWEVLSRYLN